MAEKTTPPSTEVTIAGRAFTLGAVYAPAPRVRPYELARLLPLRLLGYDLAYPWPRGRVEAELVPSDARPRTQRRRMSGRAWAAWVGEAVEGGGAGMTSRSLGARNRARGCPWMRTETGLTL